VQREKAKATDHLFSDSYIKKKLAVILNPIGGVGRAAGVKFKPNVSDLEEKRVL
jgi:hypothetical protein